METHALNVNGTAREATTDPATSLLDVLRNDLGLTAAKFGCGLGQCGACVVWVDGHPTPSCDLPVEYAAGKQITTLEGLGTPEAPHPIQSSLLTLQAAQCGYCLPGIAMAAAALLRDASHPSREQVVHALDRHLCRCGSHERIIAGVLAATQAEG